MRLNIIESQWCRQMQFDRLHVYEYAKSHPFSAVKRIDLFFNDNLVVKSLPRNRKIVVSTLTPPPYTITLA